MIFNSVTSDKTDDDTRLTRMIANSCQNALAEEENLHLKFDIISICDKVMAVGICSTVSTSLNDNIPWLIKHD